MKKIGKEKVQGYKCTIYEGDMQFSPQQPSMHMKIWYSDKLKNMLKQEATFPAPMGQIVTYLENIKTGKQKFLEEYAAMLMLEVCHEWHVLMVVLLENQAGQDSIARLVKSHLFT